MPGPADSRCGFVALVGEPNAGKSTLLNRLVGSKVSIVTHKVQTTRSRIRGIACHGASQMVFVDTPGLFEPKRTLERAMVASAWGGAADADAVALLVQAHRGVTSGVERIASELSRRIRPSQTLVLAINKIDRVKRNALLGLSKDLNRLATFSKTFMICAKTGSGCDDMAAWLSGILPEGPWHYPADQAADVPLRSLAAEITREQLTLRLHQEVPYQLTVETDGWEERKDGSIRIDQTVYVAKDGHRGIVLGPKGATVKEISIKSRKEMERVMGIRAHLFIRAQSRPGWLGEAERYSSMGLDIKDGAREA